MKAILVVDVPVLDDGRHLCNECPIWNKEHLFCQYDFNMEAKGCPLKPMPMKKVVTVKRIEDIQSYSITEVADKISAKIILKTNEVFALGWNACLDSIIGENNESNISC